jgi:hypothetical protein
MKEIDASTEKIRAPTEIRIATSKPFAATSEKDDAPVQKIVWTGEKMVASSDLVDGPDQKVGASVDDVDATDDEAGVTHKKVDATIEKVDATEKNDLWTNDDGDASDEEHEWSDLRDHATKKMIRARTKTLARRRKVIGERGKKVSALRRNGLCGKAGSRVRREQGSRAGGSGITVRLTAFAEATAVKEAGH